MTSPRHPLSHSLWALATVCALSLPVSALASDVSVKVSPASVAVGESTRLEITVDSPAAGKAQGVPELPAVEGLDIQPIGQRSSMSVINGAMKTSATFTYAVTPQRPGTYQISGVQQGGVPAQTVTLTVTRGPSAGAKASAASAQAPGGKAVSAANLAFLRLNVPKKRLFAGESVPVTVRAYFRGGIGVTLTGPPAMTTDAFTLSGLDSEPSQSPTTIDGQNHLAVTWRGVLTAVKSGAHDLRMQLPVTVQYHEAVPMPQGSADGGRHRRFESLVEQLMNGDPLSDDAFADLRGAMRDESLFGGGLFPQGRERVVTREMTLKAHHRDTRVTALPTAGRPADFSGAVGNFDLSSRLARTDLIAGEPVTLTTVVSGSGNFGLVSDVPLPESATWKAYAARASFEATDKSGYEGRKTFERSVIPTQADVQTLPALSFTYFDPASGRYVRKTAPAIEVAVEPGAAPLVAAEDAPEAGVLGGLALRSSVGRTVTSLASAGVATWVAPTAALMLLLSSLALLLAHTRRTEVWRKRAQQRALNVAVQRHRASMKAALARGNAAEFFANGQRVVQHLLAKLWNVAPAGLTLDEVTRRWPAAPHDLRALFRLGDEAEYCQQPLPTTDLQAWSLRFDHLLTTLKAPPPAPATASVATTEALT